MKRLLLKSLGFKIFALLLAAVFICIPLTLGAARSSLALPESSSSIVQAVEKLPPPSEQAVLDALDTGVHGVSLTINVAVIRQTLDALETAEQAERDRLAKEEAERKAKEEAERKAKEEAERKAKEEAERKAKEEAERKAKEEAEQNGNSSSSSESESSSSGEQPEGDLPVTGSDGPLNSLVRNGRIMVSDLQTIATEEPYDVSSSFLNAISGQDSLSVNEFKSLAATYKISAKYMQRFIDDAFVYKEGNAYKYHPVDNSLAMHSYNFDYITHGNYEKDYVVSGSSRASKGIDISSHQGDINWSSVKADGVDFAFIRIGYRGYGTGVINIDEKFHQNIKGAQAAGVKVGVYFYSQAISSAEARQEAQFVLQNLQGYTLDMPVVFDIEGGETSSWRTYYMSVQTATNVCKSFLDTVKNAGYDVMLYSYAKYLSEKVDLGQLQNYDVWLAQYYHIPFFPYNFQIWQYSASGRVNGIKGNVDMNMMFYDYRR